MLSSNSEAHVAEPADDLPQPVLVLLLLGVVQPLESLDGGLRLRRALEPRVGPAELVVGVGRVRLERRHLLQLGDRLRPALAAYVELGEREAGRAEVRVQLGGALE